MLTDCLEQADVVADDHQAALVVREEVAEPDDRVGVEVVGRLVEQQRLGAAEQDPGQLDAAALTAREGAERLVEDPFRAARRSRRWPPPRTRRRTRPRRELLLQAGVAAHRLVARLGVGAGHPALGLAQMRGRPRRGPGRRGSGRARARRGRRCAGPAGGSRRRRCAVTAPAAGCDSPARTRVRVVLPAPLRPTRPTRSPEAIRKVAAR